MLCLNHAIIKSGKHVHEYICCSCRSILLFFLVQLLQLVKEIKRQCTAENVNILIVNCKKLQVNIFNN